MYGFGLLDIVEVGARRPAATSTRSPRVYFVLSDRFRVDDLLSKISALPREDRWQTLARMALRYDLYAALAALTAEVLSGDGRRDARRRTGSRSGSRRTPQRSPAPATRSASSTTPAADLAALSVLLRQIRTLVRTSAAG